jgi:prepilin-type N-terminal cleavage/methylation domain-containing protein
VSRRSGFSLVEALVSLVILGVGIVGISQGLTLSYHSSRAAESRTAAALLASARLELIRADGILLAGEDEGDFGAGHDGWTWKEQITETAIEGLHEVHVSVHRAPSGEKIHEIRTLLYDMPWLGAATGPEEGSADERRRKERF